MKMLLALFGSPRRGGNTDILLEEMIKGAKEVGIEVKGSIYISMLCFSPCIECRDCESTGVCPLEDEMSGIYPLISSADYIVLSSPIFFYGVTAHTKAFIDRCQVFWARKYLLKWPKVEGERKGYFLSIGGSKGAKAFDGALLTVKYFFDALDVKFEKSLLYRGVDGKGEVRNHPSALREAYELGRSLKGD